MGKMINSALRAVQFLRYKAEEWNIDPKRIVVTGGFAEITAKGISVLAERAIPKAEVTKADHDAMVKEAEDALEKAKAAFENEPGPVDDAAKLLADMVAVGDHITV